MSIKKTTEITKSEDLYDKFRRGDRADWIDQVTEDRFFLMGAQLNRGDKAALDAANQFTGSTNEITPSIDLVVSMLTENNPRFSFSGVETSDSKVAGNIADLHAYIWRISKGRMVLERTVYDYVTDGMGAFLVFTDGFADFGKGEIFITDIDPRDLYISPNCKKPDCSDASHLLIVKNLTEEQVEDIIPGFDLTGLESTGGDDYPGTSLDSPEKQILDPSENEIRKFRAIDRYTKIKVNRFHVFDPISGYEKTFTEEDYQTYANEPAVIIVRLDQETYETRDSKVEELIQISEQTGGLFHEVIDPQTQQTQIVPGAEVEETSVPGSTTQIQIVTKAHLINEGIIKTTFPKITRIKRVYSIGGKEVANEILPLGDYPIVTYMLHHQRNPYPMSDIRLVKALQEQLNKIMQLILAYNTNITNVKGFVPKGSGLKKQLDETGGKAGSQWYEYDPELSGVPIIIQLTAMSTALYEEKRQITDQIQRIIGAFAISDGSPVQAPQTLGGTQLLDEFGQRRVNLKRKRMENALNGVSKVISQMIPNVYTEEKIIRISEPNHKGRESTFNQRVVDETGAEQIVNDLSIIYDVEVMSGSTLPTNKQQKLQMMQTAWQTGLIKDPASVIQYMDIADVDELLERENLIRQYEQALNQAQEEIKQLKGDLQTASRSEIQSRKRVEVVKFGADLDKVKNQVVSAAEVGKMRISDQVKESKPSNGNNKK